MPRQYRNDRGYDDGDDVCHGPTPFTISVQEAEALAFRGRCSPDHAYILSWVCHHVNPFFHFFLIFFSNPYFSSKFQAKLAIPFKYSLLD